MTFDELIEGVGNLFINLRASTERREPYPILTDRQQRYAQEQEALFTTENVVNYIDENAVNGKMVRKI